MRNPIRIVLARHAELDPRPELHFRRLSLGELIELVDLTVRMKSGDASLRELVEFVSARLLDWKNQVSVVTDEPVEFDRDRLAEILESSDLRDVMEGLQLGNQLTGDDLKKSE